MDVKTQSKDVRRIYNRKTNIEGFILFVLGVFVLFYMIYRIASNMVLVGYDGFWWSALGFHIDFFYGFLTSLVYIGSFFALMLYKFNKRIWKSVFLIDNTGNQEKIREIENALMKTNTRLTTSLINPEVKKYPNYIKSAIRGHHWILVVNDGKPLSEDNKKYIQYANKKKRIIKWYGKSDFKFDRQKVNKLDNIWGWYMMFVIISIPTIIIQALYVYMGYTYNPSILQQILMIIWIFCVPMVFMKPAIKWYRKKTRKFDKRYMNYKELKRMEAE